MKNKTKIKRNELILHFNLRSCKTILYLILDLWCISVAFCHLWCVSAMHQENLCRRGSNTPPIIHCPIWWYGSSLISEYNLSVSGSIAWSVFSYKLRYIVGFGLVEMAISTNPKPTIYRNLYENTGPERYNRSDRNSLSTGIVCRDYTTYSRCWFNAGPTS